MTKERWRQVKAIFDRTLECNTEVRAEFLRESCGSDQELQREVESLLASDRKTEFHLSNLMLPERYVVLGELGSGGMGIVYKACDRACAAPRPCGWRE